MFTFPLLVENLHLKIAGYRTIAHGGDLQGYHSYVYLVPGLNIGIFQATNLGIVYSGMHRELISAYILDIIQGETPWFTAQDVCTLFQPSKVTGIKQSDTLDHDGYPYDPLQTHNIHPSYITSPKKDQLHYVISRSSNLQLEDYIGSFGDFFYGNISVMVTSHENGTVLQMTYGKANYFLFPTDPDRFSPTGADYFTSFLDLGLVEFLRDENENVVRLTVLFEDLSGPTEFIKDLQMADAPPPPTLPC